MRKLHSTYLLFILIFSSLCGFARNHLSSINDTANTNSDVNINAGIIPSSHLASKRNFINYLPNSNGILYVKKGASGTGNSWNNAIGELADALKFAKTNNTVASNSQITQIWVAGGTYVPLYSADDNNFGNPDAYKNTFLMVKDVALYGGFAGNETMLTQRNLNITANKSTLTGTAYHILISVNNVGSALLDGFTISRINGGPLASSTIEGKYFLSLHGGGMFNYNSSPSISNCNFVSNFAESLGGAIFNIDSSSNITNCNFTLNKAYQAGAIFNASASSPTIFNCNFSENSADNMGGAIVNTDTSSPKIYNSLFVKNKSSTYNGGAIWHDGGNDALLINCTLYGNTVLGFAGGALNATRGEINVYNSLLWDNQPKQYFNQAPIVFNNSLIQGNTNTANGNLDATNISTAQIFKDAPNENFSLKLGSPAINAGDNSLYSNSGGNLTTNKDLANNPRLKDSNIDIGPYEAWPTPQTITAADITKTYGDAPFILTAKASSGLEVSYVSADNSIAEAFQDSVDGNKWKLKIHKAGEVNITAKQTGNDNYSPAPDVIFKLMANNAVLTITANALSKEYGTADPALTYITSGLLNGDTEAILTGSLSRTVGEAVGTYTIGQGTLSAENYDIAYTNANLTITPAPGDFITVWDMSIPSGSGIANQLSFYVTISLGESVDYFWTASGGSNGRGIITLPNGFTFGGIVISVPANEIITLNLKPTHFKAFSSGYFGSGVFDTLRLVDVLQWGTTEWSMMRNAFLDCTNLNITATDIPDLRNVTDLSGMFRNCTSLSGPANIGNWNIANVTTIHSMFKGAETFNQNIGNWNTANVTNMIEVFNGASVFNQDIGNWNTQNVVYMYYMFANAIAFNQNISRWNTEDVNFMEGMFNNAEAFNQNIGSWKLPPNVHMDNMFDNSGMDCQNYSFTLNGWANNATTPSGRNLGALGRQYGTNATAARTTLTTTKGWTITGDSPSGQSCGLSQTITAADITKTYGDAPFITTATASSGLEVSYVSADNSIAEAFQDSADGNKWKLRIKKAGVVNITAKQAGNDIYNPATDVIFTLTINKAALTVIANTHSKIYGTTDPSLTYVVNGLVNGDTESVISGSLTRAAGENIGTYAIEQGTVNAENYIITYTGADFNITKATLNIVADAKSKAFGATDPALTYTVTGLVNGDTESIIIGSLSRDAGEAVGIYAIMQGSLSAGNNYNINFTGADFTIIERLIVDTSTQTNVTCNGGSDGSATVSITGGAAPYTYSWSPNGGTAATATGLAAGNYTVTITDVNGSTITKNFSITQPPAVEPPTAQDIQEFCRAANPTISDLEIVGTQVKWYASANATQELPGNTLLVNGTTYYASQTVNGCESQEKTLVIITLNDLLPTPGGATVQNFEEGATIADLVVTPANSVWYASHNDAVNNINPLSPTTELEDGATYYAVAMANGQCSSLPFAVTINVTLGIGNPQEVTFKYYPNPVNDYLNIRSSGTIDAIEVYSLLGQLVKKQDSHSGEVRLFFGDLSDGIYAVTILSEGKKSTVKVVKK